MENHIEHFKCEDAQSLLRNKYILFIGDSVIRAMYKDMVKLLQSNELLKEQQLKIKGEFYFENDELLEGGQKGIMSNDTTYTEIRQFCRDQHIVKFYFVTRCYSDYLMSVCGDLRRDPVKPDVVIMNSGCWDLTRYGSGSRQDYRRNLPMGIYSLLQVLPATTLFIWTTTMPLSKEVRGGFMVPETECMQSRLRHDVLDANFYASLIMKAFNVDLIDMHYYFKNLIKHRMADGIHWDVIVHRRITNILLSHIGDSWGFRLPSYDQFRQRLEMDAENFVDDADEYQDAYYDDYGNGGYDMDYGFMGMPPNDLNMLPPPQPFHMQQNGLMPIPAQFRNNMMLGNGIRPNMPMNNNFAPQGMPPFMSEQQGRVNQGLSVIHSTLMAAAAVVAQRQQQQQPPLMNRPLMSIDFNNK